MNPVSMSKAAKEAGVTRQAIYNLSKKTLKPLFFVNINNHPPLVDLDDPTWTTYCVKVKTRNPMDDDQLRLVRILIDFLKDYGWTGDDLKSAVIDIQQRYRKLRR